MISFNWPIFFIIIKSKVNNNVFIKIKEKKKFLSKNNNYLFVCFKTNNKNIKYINYENYLIFKTVMPNYYII